MRSLLDSTPTIEAAASIIYRAMEPTAQRRYPLLDARCGTEVWVKHENHTPIGAFKVRGGLVYMEHLHRTAAGVPGVIAATRGNHGQSIAFAAARYGVPCAVVVPHGNSVSKNRAMQALGAELLEHGHDFQASLEAARQIAADRGWHLVPSFDALLVAGVATAAWELLRAVPDLATLYVPIGLGSGICGAMAARAELGRATEIVGVVAAGAPASAPSQEAGRIVPHDVFTRIADGLACRIPVADALEQIRRGVSRVLEVTDEEIEDAMKALFDDTHTVAEGAGASGLAALLKDRRPRPGAAGFVLTGANVDSPLFARALAR